MCLGVSAPVGAALIGAGINSLATGSICEFRGGSYTAGWWGGQIGGMLAGAGAAFGSAAILEMLQSFSLTSLAKAVFGTTTSYITGVASSFLNNTIRQMIDRQISLRMIEQNLRSSYYLGIINIFSGFGSVAIQNLFKPIAAGASVAWETFWDTAEFVYHEVKHYFKKIFS